MLEELLHLVKPLGTKRYKPVRVFLRGVPSGAYGTSKRSVMREAKQRFGPLPDVDWDQLRLILETLVPILLKLLV